MMTYSTLDARLQFIFKSVLCRNADAQELAVLKESFNEQLSKYTKNPAEADKLLVVGESKANEKLNKPVLSAFTMVANIVLNLDEAVTK